MKKLQENIFWVIAGVAVLVFIGFALANSNETKTADKPANKTAESTGTLTITANLDEFATCLGEKGAKFYGAYWCSFCNKQKELFGSSVELMPYIECAVEGQDGQTQVCIDNNIQSYPTWVFADGSQESGVQSLEKLANKTGCALPTNN